MDGGVVDMLHASLGWKEGAFNKRQYYMHYRRVPGGANNAASIAALLHMMLMLVVGRTKLLFIFG